MITLPFAIELSPEDAAALDDAARARGVTVDELVTYLLEQVAEGLTRPGSWEHANVTALLGGLRPGREAHDDPEGAA